MKLITHVVLALFVVACTPDQPNGSFLDDLGNNGQADTGGTDAIANNGTPDMQTTLDASADATPDVAVDTGPDATPDADTGVRSVLSFFATSTGSAADGGNLNGLAGADAKCLTLATAVGADDRTWAAYLSTDAENARDRIGAGPWFNQAETMVGADIATLHANGIPEADVLDETGALVPRAEHDMLTGSDAMGNVMAALTCMNWTSNANADQNQVGHADYMTTNGSWNSTHASPCDEVGISNNAGAGRFYCFATD